MGIGGEKGKEGGCYLAGFSDSFFKAGKKM